MKNALARLYRDDPLLFLGMAATITFGLSVVVPIILILWRATFDIVTGGRG